MKIYPKTQSEPTFLSPDSKLYCLSKIFIKTKQNISYECLKKNIRLLEYYIRIVSTTYLFDSKRSNHLSVGVLF